MCNVTDGDGYVKWDDYQRLVDRYLSAYKIGKNDRRAQGTHRRLPDVLDGAAAPRGRQRAPE